MVFCRKWPAWSDAWGWHLSDVPPQKNSAVYPVIFNSDSWFSCSVASDNWGPEHQENSQPAKGIRMRSVRTRKKIMSRPKNMPWQKSVLGRGWRLIETTWNKMKIVMKQWDFYPNGSKWYDKDMFNRMAQPWRQVYIGAWIRISNGLLSCIGPAAHATYHQKYQNIGIFIRQKATIPLHKVKL